MTQEQKELLLKDLYSRLSHGVRCEVVKRNTSGEMLFIRNGSGALELTVNNVKELVTNNMYEIKPYLFPLSSMTEEQWKELKLTMIYTFGTLCYTLKTYDYFYKNHIDIRGLILMGLAIDATNLNIY